MKCFSWNSVRALTAYRCSDKRLKEIIFMSESEIETISAIYREQVFKHQFPSCSIKNNVETCYSFFHSEHKLRPAWSHSLIKAQAGGRIFVRFISWTKVEKLSTCIQEHETLYSWRNPNTDNTPTFQLTLSCVGFVVIVFIEISFHLDFLYFLM